MRKMTKLGKWQFGAAIPPIVALFLGWQLIVSGSESIAVIWSLLLLPFAWGAVAATIVLTLSPAERLLLRGTLQPFWFFFLWSVSAVWSLFTLPGFPYLDSNLAVPGEMTVIVLCIVHLIIIAVVVWAFARQCKSDIHNRKI